MLIEDSTTFTQASSGFPPQITSDDNFALNVIDQNSSFLYSTTEGMMTPLMTSMPFVFNTSVELDEEYVPPRFQLLGTEAPVVVSVVIIVLSFFSFVANAVTILVLWRPLMLKSVFNFFIVSLAASDLISALICPLHVYQKLWDGFDYWEIGTFLCKVFWSGDIGTSVLTSLHILVFSALRFSSLKWPHAFSRFTIRRAKLTILFLWVVSLTCGFLPFLIWVDVRVFNRKVDLAKYYAPSCTLASRKTFRQFGLYAKVGYCVFFFIPCVLIFILSLGASLLMSLKRRQRIRDKQRHNLPSPANQREMKRQRKENQAILQLLLIVSSFLVGYLPFCAHHIYITAVQVKSAVRSWERNLSWWLGIFAYICLRISECLNPIFYNLASSKVRKETVTFLRKIFRLREAQPEIELRPSSSASGGNNQANRSAT